MAENRFGGERLDSKSALSKNNLLEHLVRYIMVAGDKSGHVLDVGCGSGHGSSVLAKHFKKVTGLDNSAEALDYARKNWGKSNITYREGSALDIPFKDNTFDSIAAFEVFEHMPDWKKFLSELKRVAKPKALIYLSTPNKSVYSPGTKKPINPHHFFEMTESEFYKALENYFEINHFYGQRTPIYNDHWIWSVVNPFLFTFKAIIPYKVNNTVKLKIINWIKPELESSDIVFSEDKADQKRSRFLLAICINRKN